MKRRMGWTLLVLALALSLMPGFAPAAEPADRFFDLYAEDAESPTVVGAQAANDLLDIKGVKASFVLTRYQGKIYISARSIDEVNVQLIMERMGGGGHLNIAGCQLENTTIEKAIDTLKTTISDMMEAGDIG